MAGPRGPSAKLGMTRFHSLRSLRRDKLSKFWSRREVDEQGYSMGRGEQRSPTRPIDGKYSRTASGWQATTYVNCLPAFRIKLQSVQLTQAHHQLQYQGTVLYFPSSCSLKATEQHGDSWFFGRLMSLSYDATSAYRTLVGLIRSMLSSSLRSANIVAARYMVSG